MSGEDADEEIKSALAALVADYRAAKQRAWEAQPLRKPEQPDDDADLVAAADATLDRLARGEEATISLEDWERRHGLGG